jgi:hypothetical protein
MSKETELFKDIPNFKDLYQISNLGNVKSLSRLRKHYAGGFARTKEKILSNCIDNNGYYLVNLTSNNKSKTHQIHKLMAITFLNHIPCGHKLVVDHINNKPLDNRIENLQLISHRENLTKDGFRRNLTSDYAGVCWVKRDSKWRASLRINESFINIGSYKDEKVASEIYDIAVANKHIYKSNNSEFRKIINEIHNQC